MSCEAMESELNRAGWLMQRRKTRDCVFRLSSLISALLPLTLFTRTATGQTAQRPARQLSTARLCVHNVKSQREEAQIRPIVDSQLGQQSEAIQQQQQQQWTVDHLARCACDIIESKQIQWQCAHTRYLAGDTAKALLVASNRCVTPIPIALLSQSSHRAGRCKTRRIESVAHCISHRCSDGDHQEEYRTPHSSPIHASRCDIYT